MRERGFTLLELVVVVTIIGILLAIATLQFNQYSRKANIEKQVRSMYADLMKARSEALLQKNDRSVTVTATQYSVYPSSDGSGTFLLQTALKYPVAYVGDTFSFDSRGVTCDKDGTKWLPDTAKTICATPAVNPAAIDSILITATGMQMGKCNGSCDSAHFTAK